jgi:hypothetical protein
MGEFSRHKGTAVSEGLVVEGMICMAVACVWAKFVNSSVLCAPSSIYFRVVTKFVKHEAEEADSHDFLQLMLTMLETLGRIRQTSHVSVW